jgi:hypothetical protein
LVFDNKVSDSCYARLYVRTFPDNIHANAFLPSRVGVATTGSDRIEIDLPSKGSELRSKLTPKFGVLEDWRGDVWPSSNWSSGVVMDGRHQMTEYIFEKYEKKIRSISHVICLV